LNKKHILPILVFTIFLVITSSYACDIIQEGTNERTTYCRNGDGTATVTDRYYNYINEYGEWEHITGDIEYSNHYEVTKGWYESHFWGIGNRWVEVVREDKSINIFPHNYQGDKEIISNFKQVEPVSEGNTLIFPYVTDSVSVEYTYYPEMLKEKFILHDSGALPDKETNEVFFYVQMQPVSDLDIYINDKEWNGKRVATWGEIEFKKDGETVFFLPKPTAYDSADNEINLHYEIMLSGKNLFVMVVVPYEWLSSEERVYPIVVDPTTSITESRGFVTGDCWVGSIIGGGTTNYGTDGSQFVGYIASPSEGIFRQYVQINFTNLTNAINITNATYYQKYFAQAYDTGQSDRYEQAYYCNDTFGELTITYNNQDTEINKSKCSLVHNTRLITNNTTERWYQYDFTAQANTEVSDDQTFTIYINSTNETGGVNERNGYRSREYATTNDRPYFEITYNYTKHIFKAYDRRNSQYISDFFLTMRNSTTNQTYQANGTSLTIEQSTAVFGNVTLIFEKNGYNASYNITTITDSTFLNMTQNLEEAGLEANVFDEETLSNITYNITVSNSTQSEEFLNQTNGVFWNYTQIPTGSLTIVVNSDGYEQRTYYETMSAVSFVNLTSYLLSTSEGLIRSFVVVNSNYQQLSGATVTIKRFINDTWTTVGEKTTDDSGVATFFMNPAEQYQIEATYQGLTSGVQTIQPTESSYTIIIPTVTEVVTFDSSFDQVEYKINPKGMWLEESNNTSITFLVNCWSEDLEYFNLTLKDQNYTTIDTQSSTSDSGGVLVSVIDTTNISRVYGTFSLKRDNRNEYTFTRNWIVEDLTPTNYSLVGALFTFADIPDDEMGMGAKMIVVLVVATAIMGSAIAFGLGGFVSAIIGASVITIFTLFGWFPATAMVLIWAIILGISFLTRGI